MNISTSSSTQAPAPPIKAGGSSTRTRAQGDTEQDASTGVAFLSMLQALTEPSAPSEPTDPGQAVALDATTPNTAPAAPPIISTTTEDAAALHGAEETLAPAGRLPSLRAAQGHRASDDASAEKHRARATELGVEVYMGKPFQEEELLRNIRQIVAARAAAVPAA